jgi:hypothetical protein
MTLQTAGQFFGVYKIKGPPVGETEDPSYSVVFLKSLPRPYMAKYGVKIFGFLWHYLKETPSRKDRVAFLNSLRSEPFAENF